MLPEKKPTLERRVQQILQGLSEGKTRDELADSLGYTNPRSLDTYMRRRDFTWDSELQNYVQAKEKVSKVTPIALTSNKATTVISLFSREGADAKAIAKQLGFTDHRELANYMRGKGYVWDAEQNNYIKGEVEAEGREPVVPIEATMTSATFSADSGFVAELLRYLPLLQMLEQNSAKLSEMFDSKEAGQIPRYVLPGVPVTKSVHMMNTLDQMVRDFSREKNVSQRDLFEVALLDFFRKYGYEREVEALLRQS